MDLRRIFALIIVVLAFVPAVLAVESTKPQWDEFYPTRTYNMEYLPTDKAFAKSLSGWSLCRYDDKKWVKGAINTFMGINCWWQSNSAAARIAMYNNTVPFWNEKQIAFNTLLAACDAKPKNQQGSCYIEVRELLTTQKPEIKSVIVVSKGLDKYIFQAK